MATFEEILNRNSDEVEAPAALPPGIYMGIIDGPHKQITASTGTPGFQFIIRLGQPVSDVDQEQLAKAKGSNGKTVRHTIYVADGQDFYLKDFLLNILGIPGGRGFKEEIAEAPGKQLGVVLRNKITDSEPKRVIHIVDSVKRI